MADFGDFLNGDAVMACADLVGRAGAERFEMGYVHDDAPTVAEAGWYAVAYYRGVRLIAEDHQSPTLAAAALAERLLRGAACRCGQQVVLRDGAAGCRWQLVGPRWEPGCDVEPVAIKGKRGDYAAMQQAMNARRVGRRG